MVLSMINLILMSMRRIRLPSNRLENLYSRVSTNPRDKSREPFNCLRRLSAYLTWAKQMTLASAVGEEP